MKQVSSIRARCSRTYNPAAFYPPITKCVMRAGCSTENGRKSLFALLESKVSLLDEAELDTLGGEEGDHRLLALTDDEHVG